MYAQPVIIDIIQNRLNSRYTSFQDNANFKTFYQIDRIGLDWILFSVCFFFFGLCKESQRCFRYQHAKGNEKHKQHVIIKKKKRQYQIENKTETNSKINPTKWGEKNNKFFETNEKIKTKVVTSI